MCSKEVKNSAYNMIVRPHLENASTCWNPYTNDRISELLHSMQSCMCDVKALATANILKLNDNKTELMLVTSKRTKNIHSLPTSITIGNAQIPFKQSVKNLGLTLDCHLTLNAHVSNIARTCYFELRRLASIVDS